MKETRLIMGMPITVEIIDRAANDQEIAAVFDYFTSIDNRFSTYKPESEMMRINRGEIAERDWSDDMRIIFMLAEETKLRTGGFFDIKVPGARAGGTPFYDPSGIVKGWAIFQAAKILEGRGFKNFYIEAGGDIQTSGINAEGTSWSIGIRNPIKNLSTNAGHDEIVKTIYAPADGIGIATSGTYIRGEHIYNPHDPVEPREEAGKNGEEINGKILSLTVIGQNIYEADRFATAAFAMGASGLRFIQSLPGFEGYMIDANGIATMTSGFEAFTKK